MNRPIALLTDFGTKDPFVGIMKGVILGINPSAQIVDIIHDVEAGDIRTASYALLMAFPYMPAESIIVAVVDPDVGAKRRAVAVEIEGRIALCPDNGLLSWVTQKREISGIFELSNYKYFLPEISSTFHGRDVFAPAAAHLSKGVSICELGDPVDNLLSIPIPQVVSDQISLRGEVVYIDKFGNVLCNITRSHWNEWMSTHPDGDVRISLGTTEVQKISSTYSDVPHGQVAALFGSAGVLELAINGGNLAEDLGIKIGAHVTIFFVGL